MFSSADQPLTISGSVTSSDGTVTGGNVSLDLSSLGLGSAVLVSVSGGTFSTSVTLAGGTAVGNYTISATYEGSTDFAASSTGTGTVSVSPAPIAQTITFSPLVGVTYGDADFAINATATSGLPVSFTASGDASVKQVAGVWYVHITGAGSATITAHQTGDSNYSSAPDVAQGLTIAKATAAVVVTPYTSADTTYDGNVHTAAITSITGVNGETGATVGTVDVSHTKHTNAGTYVTDSWSFTGAANYNDINSTTIIDSIAKATAVVVVTPYTAPTRRMTAMCTRRPSLRSPA